MTKKDFRDHTSLKNIWNKIIVWNDMHLATVMWDNNPWKVIDEGITFEQLTNSVETPLPSKVFNLTYLKRTYTPIAEFHTQEELWEYIKTL